MATHQIHKVVLTSGIHQQSLQELRKSYCTSQDSQQKSGTSLIEFNHLKMQLAELKSKQIHINDIFKQIRLIKQFKLNKYRFLYSYDQECSIQKVMRKLQNKAKHMNNEKQALVSNTSPQKLDQEALCNKIINRTTCSQLPQLRARSDNNENTVIQANV